MPALNRTVILIVGAALLVGVALLGFFMLVKPQLQTIASLKSEIEQHNTYAAKKPTVQRELGEAQTETVRVQTRMDDIYRRKMPGIALRVPVWSMFSLWYETGPGPDWFKRMGMGPGPLGTGTLLARYFESIGLPVEGIGMPQWGIVPPDRSMRTLPPLPLTLRFRFKSFQDFLKLFDKFEGAPRFLVVQGARVSGFSPNLVAEVSVVVYAWTRDYAGPPAAPAAAPTPARATSAAAPAAAGAERAGGEEEVTSLKRRGGMRRGGED